MTRGYPKQSTLSLIAAAALLAAISLASSPASAAGNGVAVGWASKAADGSIRAVRWDASGAAATELGNLGTDSSGSTGSQAYAVNTAGTAVGVAVKYTGGTYLGGRAVLWDLDGAVFDRNALIDPNSGWVNLYEARGISDTNWVTGTGSFDADGAGPQAAYTRAFLLDVSSAVPEPSRVALLTLAVPALRRRRHQSRERPQEEVTRPPRGEKGGLTSS